MIINNRFTLSFVLALAAVTAPSSVQANDITKAQKKEWRKTARRAARQCKEYKNQKVQSPIIATQECAGGGHTATVAILDKQTKVELGLVKIGCDSTTEVLCGPRCDFGPDDCTDDTWCRLSETIGYAVCVDYAAIGESCGGFTLPGQQSRCNPATSACVYPPQVSLIPDLPGKCELKCKEDKDCGKNQWCQPQGVLDYTIPKPSPKPIPELSICSDYVGEDEYCGGFTTIQDQRRCNPNTMQCVVEDPMIADASGKCKLRCESKQDCGRGKACNEGLCFETCDEDEDCPNDNYWCRPKRDNNVSVCTLVVGYGEACGATGNPWEEDRCSDFLLCMPNPDGSSTCQFPIVLPVPEPVLIDEGKN